VTGDTRLLKIKNYEETKIVSVKEFIKLLEKSKVDSAVRAAD